MEEAPTVNAPSLFVAGQGSGAISADNLNSLEQTCDNLTELRGLVGVPGMQVSVRGTNTPDDGGGGFFYWDSNSSAADNGSTIIRPIGGGYLGRWLYLSFNFGTVTSVGLTLPSSVFTVTGSPVTTSGTLDGELAAQSANTVFAGPTSGADAQPTFRAIGAGDVVGGVSGQVLTATGPSSAAVWLASTSNAGPGYSQLKIASLGASNSTSVITTASIALFTSSGGAYIARAVNVSPIITASGANGLDTGSVAASTWYNVFVILNPTTSTVAGLFSLSASAPSLPSGYTAFTRVGAVRTDSSGSKYLLQTLQYGRWARWVVLAGSNVPGLPTIASGVIGSVSTPTWVASSMASFAPPTSAAYQLTAYCGGAVVMAAPNNSYGAYNNQANPPPLCINNVSGNNFTAIFAAESANIYIASNGSTNSVLSIGWEDNL